MTYRVKFRLGAKKLQMVVEAGDANEAKEIIRNKIVFDSVVKESQDSDYSDSFVNDFIGSSDIPPFFRDIFKGRI